MADFIEVTCPFCGEGGFDRFGLKNHFERGCCEVYERTTAENYDGAEIEEPDVPPFCPACGDHMTMGIAGAWECNKIHAPVIDDEPTPF